MSTDLFAVADATWPAASTRKLGPWTIREGQGGGQRVSAATREGPLADIDAAEAAMADLGQSPLFMVRGEDAALDGALAARGYVVKDPVVIYSAAAASIASTPPPPVSTFTLWEPLTIMKELWAEGGIGPARLAVMGRVTGPKTAVLGRSQDRSQDRAAGVAFVAIHGKTAMLHALEVTPKQRRQGTAVNIMRRAAQWALDHGANTLTLLVTEANAPARALYASLGMQVVGHYHYRTTEAR